MDQTDQIGMPILLVAGLLGMLLLAIAIVLFFVVYQKRLAAQQEKLLRIEFDYQKELLDSSIQIQEVERKRIAADLHDSVGSQLSATKLYLKQLNPKQPENNLDHLKKEALGLIEETILNIRQITQNLLPLSLERFGLIAAIEDLVERLNELNQAQIDFQYTENKRFSVQKETALYRIVQELINNTIKHANANKVEIKLEFVGQQLIFHYQDDGLGFDWNNGSNENAKPRGLGMKSIETRAKFLNAKLDFSSSINQGMQVQIQLDWT